MKDQKFSLLNLTAAGGLAAVGGIWLIVSPFVLNYSGKYAAAATKVNADNAALLGIICGAVALVLAFGAIVTERIEKLQTFRFSIAAAFVVLGIFLMAAPYLFNYSKLRDPLWNLQVTGGIFALIAGFILQELYYTAKEAKEATQAQLTGSPA